jgi:hypothetical protein
VAGDVANLSVSQTVEYIGGTKTRDVASVSVTTASGVYFEFRIPRADFTAAVAETEAKGYAAQVESLLTNPNVAGVQWSQDANTAGYLLDVGTITVQSKSGDSSLAFTVPWGHVFVEAISGRINTLAGELDAVEKAGA